MGSPAPTTAGPTSSREGAPVSTSYRPGERDVNLRNDGYSALVADARWRAARDDAVRRGRLVAARAPLIASKGHLGGPRRRRRPGRPEHGGALPPGGPPR